MIRDISLIVVLIVGLQSFLFSQELSPNSRERSKIASSLRNRKIESVRVLVKDKSTFIQWMIINFPGVEIAEEKLHHVYRIKISSVSEVEKLAKAPSVEFIDRENRMPTEEKALGAFDLTLNKIYAAQRFYNTTGEGLVASIKEKPFDVEDIDLKNRVVLTNQFDEPSTLHATSMATIIAGAGNSEPSGRGVAPGAEVTTSDFLQLLPDEGSVLTSLHVSLQNHSYGVGVENYYGIESSAY
ncbi:MAG TPA: S8 family serine peptidase, partial [Cyclobacteriaceae bacterium]|nr:S8 family serine peptidase [Cyclobacteriaceae bacterium]